MALRLWSWTTCSLFLSAMTSRNVARELAAETLRSMRLTELRKVFALTQVQLAKRMGCSQARISEAENRPDMLVSTFLGYLHGLGANPRVVVDVPGEGEVRVELGALLSSSP